MNTRLPDKSLRRTYTVSTIIDYEPIDGSHLLSSDPATKIKTLQVKFKYFVKGVTSTMFDDHNLRKGRIVDHLLDIKERRDGIVEHSNKFFKISSDFHIGAKDAETKFHNNNDTYEVFTIIFTLPTQDLLKHCFTLESNEDSLISKLKQIIVYPNLDEKRYTGPRLGRITPQDTKKRIDGEVIQLLEEFTRSLP